MSLDPYDEVKSEIVSSLSTLTSLLSRHKTLTHSTSPTELSYSASEIEATLQVLDGDLDELDESVRAVEERGVRMRLGLGVEEVKARRRFVEETREKIKEAQTSLGITPNKRHSSALPLSSYGHPLSSLDGTPNEDEGGDDFEVQHQSYLMEQQDQTLTSISGTVGLLRDQAKVMGREVVDQNELLDRLEAGVDDTGAKLGKAQRRMAKFIKENQSSPSSWLVFVLMIVLSVMLFIILFV